MKNVFVATLSSLVVSANAKNGFRGFVNDVFRKNDAKTEDAADGITAIGNEERNLWPAHMPMNSCSRPAQWHPTYSAGWSHGYCQFTIDCDSPGYASELQCCNAAYGHQNTGFCLSQLPNPPTSSPTDIGGPSIYYPDYDSAWPDGSCINTRPMPSGRPTYTSMFACCKAAYGGQLSGKCLSMLPSPPTGSPTSEDYETDFWYPMYDLAWNVGGCSNKLPLPYNNINDRPNYPTQVQCCKTAYAGQISGMCLSMLPNAPNAPALTGKPTVSPTVTVAPSVSAAPSDVPSLSAAPSVSAAPSDAPSVSVSPTSSSAPTKKPPTTPAPTATCLNLSIRPFDGPGAACHHSDCCCVNAETVKWALINGDVQVGNEDDICVRDHGADGFTVAHNCVGVGTIKTACCRPGLPNAISEPKVISAPLRGGTCNKIN